LGALRGSPVVVPALGAIAVFVAWSTDDGGYPLTHWAPGGLIMLALVAIAVFVVGFRPRELPRELLVALACLAAYTAWCFLSIIWSDVPGTAFEGADRTLLYLLVFVLFAGFAIDSEGAALLLLTWTLAMVGVAVYTGIHLDTLGASGLRTEFAEGRLLYPAGYVNATAGQWMMAAWPAALLARSERLHPALRGVLAGGAVILAAVALLSLSRGATLASAAVLVLVFALVPRRLRTFAYIIPILLGLAACVPVLLRVGDRLEHGAFRSSAVASAQSALHEALLVTLAAAIVVGLVTAGAAVYERSASFSADLRLSARRAAAALATLVVVAGVGAGLAAAGNPVTRVRHAWDTFKSPRGYEANAHGNRLISGLGSNRYDFYRVALDEFAAHPLLGTGVDSFAQEYLRHGRSGESPRYPHSVEVRTLSQTGIVGALLALAGFLAALLAGMHAMRRRGALGAAVAAAALTGFAYWVVHGSADWFWEYAGLGAPAFALLGIACAMAPRPQRPARPAARRGRWRGVAWGIAGVVVAGAAGIAFVLPWVSGLEVHSAASVWTQSRAAAYSRLSSAASTDPLSAEPYLVAGTVAARYGELGRADHDFALALGRAPEDEYATLERGAIASSRGERARALALLRRALRLYPHDFIAREALEETEAGMRVEVTALNDEILTKAEQLE
jgi:O-antigen ligase